MGAIKDPDWAGRTFDGCVDLLCKVANRTGLSYKQVNVIAFCFAWPIVTVGLATTVAVLAHRR